MFNKVIKKIKYSSLSFYYHNLKWNVLFWLNCTKIYKELKISKKTNDFHIDSVGKMHYLSNVIKKRKFYGYMYKGNIYFDNPGMPIKERELWVHWKNKKLIK